MSSYVGFNLTRFRGHIGHFLHLGAIFTWIKHKQVNYHNFLVVGAFKDKKDSEEGRKKQKRGKE